MKVLWQVVVEEHCAFSSLTLSDLNQAVLHFILCHRSSCQTIKCILKGSLTMLKNCHDKIITFFAFGEEDYRLWLCYFQLVKMLYLHIHDTKHFVKTSFIQSENKTDVNLSSSRDMTFISILDKSKMYFHLWFDDMMTGYTRLHISEVFFYFVLYRYLCNVHFALFN